MAIGGWGRAVPVFFLTAVAFADLEAEVGNGDVVTGTLSPGTERETLRFAVPKDAVIAVSARGVQRPGFLEPAPVVSFVVYGPNGAVIGTANSKASGAKLKKLRAPVTGAYSVVVSGDGTAGDYTAIVSWVSRSAFPVSLELGGSPQRFDFACDAGATATFKVSSKKSAALPRLVEVRDAADASIVQFAELADAAAKKHLVKDVVLTSGGVLSLVVGDAGGGGAIAGSVILTQPLSLRRAISLTTIEIPGAGPTARSILLGPEGGLLGSEGIALIGGSSVEIPVGALGSPTAIVIGTSEALEPEDASVIAGGPAVYFGPDGLTFEGERTADVTLPFDPSLFPLGTDGLRVFTRDENGVVTEITPLAVDPATSTVTFPASHFSSFQVFGPPPPPGAPPLPVQGSKIAARSASANDRFAASCAVFGDTLVVGELFGEVFDGTTDGGAIRIYGRGISGVWIEEYEFEPSGAGLNQRFGESVAIVKGPITAIAVGASLRASIAPAAQRAGALFLYAADGPDWFEDQILRASDPVTDGHLGAAVAMSGDTLVAGADGARDAGNVTRGGVYVFRQPVDFPWSQQAKIVPADAVASGGAGATVAIDGDTLAFGTASLTGGSGAVWIYTRTGTVWTLEQKLEAELPSAGDGFGKSAIALSGDTIAVGVTRTGQPAEVQIFTRSGTTWTREEVLGARGVASFATSISLSGDRLYVGAPLAMGPVGADQGLVQVYRRTAGEWSLPATLRPADTNAGQQFGNVVAANATDVVVGSIAQGSFAGAAYVFDAGP